MRHLILFACAAALAAPAAAQTMNAEDFHRRATALQKKGAMAMFSRGEIKVLMGEVKASGEAARAARVAAQAAGKTPRYCPTGDKFTMSSDEFMKRLSAIPQAERRRITMTEASTRIFAAKFPCNR